MQVYHIHVKMQTLQKYLSIVLGIAKQQIIVVLDQKS